MSSVPQYNVDGMLFFPGKELSDANIAGKRLPHKSIRIAVGAEGVYKFQSDNDDLIMFWKYSDIIDWSYSGYSFTLNLKDKVDYHVRTNDGPSISHWIETFSKSPDKAATEVWEMKNLGGVPPTVGNQPVFYTLNTRKRHNRTGNNTHSRLLSAYGVDQKQQSSSHSNNSNPVINGTDLKRWSTELSGVERGKGRGYRSGSGDKSNIANDTRAKSMECLTNGTSSPAHTNGDSKSIEDDDTPPIAPPRNASLKSISPLVQTTPPITPHSERSIMIRVSDSDNSPSSQPKNPHPHSYEEIEIGVPHKYNKLEILPNDQQSKPLGDGDYDHLFPGKKDHKPAIRRKEKEEVVFTPLRRNESLPPMAYHSPVLDKHEMPPQDDESDSEMDDEPVSPLPSDQFSDDSGPIVMRQKPEGTDPFADLFSAPASKSRLRWSQELNPIYDYIRGVKISPKIGYDSLATSAENTIQEEETGIVGDDTTSISSSDRRSSSDSQFEGLVFVPQSAPNTLQRMKRVPHCYEEIVFGEPNDDTDTRSHSSTGHRPMSEHYSQQHIGEVTLGVSNKDQSGRSSPLRRLKSSDTPFAVSPQLNKRVLHRKSKTVRATDDTHAPQGSQQARRVADTMRDFSYITREYRVFFIKMPSGHLISEVVNINRPVAVLLDKLAELLGSRTTDSYSLFVEGAILTTMKEASLEFGELQPAKAQVYTSSVSLTQLVDNNSLADQGEVPILLKNNLSFRKQGITTARILRLDDADDIVVTDLQDVRGSVKQEFHKAWLSVVQGNQPTTLENAVKLAALQYQAYFLERTAENSVIGFCRPTEFLPAEFAGVRAIEGKIYKEQEKIKSKDQAVIQKSYVKYCKSLPTSNTLFFPVREARRRILHSAKLKPVLLGVNKHGIVRVCPKTKEVLESWEYQVLKNWAYSRRTFVVAFSNKNYPVESNQAKWISDLVDFHVQSIMQSSQTPPTSTN